MSVLLVRSDARSIPLADKSVHCCVTSPPYWGLRDYGTAEQLGLEDTPEAYVANMVEVFREVRRVLRDDGSLWLNLGDSYASSPASGGEQSATMTGGEHKRTPRTRYTRPPGLKPKDLVGIPWRVAFALQADGWYLRSDIIWHKPNPMPESVRDRPTKAHEYLFLLTKSKRYYYDADAINPAGRNKRSVWTVATAPYAGAHFAVFPPKLIEPCILAGCPEGGTVLDPFAGSGTTGRVAIANRRRAVLCDVNAEYLSKQATKRTSNVQIGLAL